MYHFFDAPCIIARLFWESAPMTFWLSCILVHPTAHPPVLYSSSSSSWFLYSYTWLHYLVFVPLSSFPSLSFSFFSHPCPFSIHPFSGSQLAFINEWGALWIFDADSNSSRQLADNSSFVSWSCQRVTNWTNTILNIMSNLESHAISKLTDKYVWLELFAACKKITFLCEQFFCHVIGQLMRWLWLNTYSQHLLKTFTDIWKFPNVILIVANLRISACVGLIQAS